MEKHLHYPICCTYQMIRSTIKIGVMVNRKRITSMVTVHYPAKDILLIKNMTLLSNESLFLSCQKKKGGRKNILSTWQTILYMCISDGCAQMSTALN